MSKDCHVLTARLLLTHFLGAQRGEGSHGFLQRTDICYSLFWKASAGTDRFLLRQFIQTDAGNTVQFLPCAEDDDVVECGTHPRFRMQCEVVGGMNPQRLEAGGRTWSVGDRLRVRVERVDFNARLADFIPAESVQGTRGARPRRRK